MSRDLRHRVTIQQNLHTRTNGVKSDSWVDIETVYARIKTMGGSEVVRADQKEAVFSHEIETRYRGNFGSVLELVEGGLLELVEGGYLYLVGFGEMLPRYRAKFGTKIFNIYSVVQPYSGTDKVIFRAKEVVT